MVGLAHWKIATVAPKVALITLVPAVMSLRGDTAWWLPRRLDKAMPSVDIEGESLRTVQK